MPGLYGLVSRSVGEILTAAKYNSDHVNHRDNHIPSMIDDYASTLAEFKATTDPGEAASESLPASLAGELERLRFAIGEIKRQTEWYESNFLRATFKEGAAPGTPGAGLLDLYAKTNNRLAYKNPSGVEVEIVGQATTILLLPIAANLPSTGAPTLVLSDAVETWYELEYSDASLQVADFEIPAGAFNNVRVIWRSAATAGNVQWYVEVKEKGDGDALGAGAVVASATITDTAKAVAWQLNEATVALAYSPGANKRLALVRVYRNPGGAGDTLGAAARFLSLETLP